MSKVITFSYQSLSWKRFVVPVTLSTVVQGMTAVLLCYWLASVISPWWIGLTVCLVSLPHFALHLGRLPKPLQQLATVSHLLSIPLVFGMSLALDRPTEPLFKKKFGVYDETIEAFRRLDGNGRVIKPAVLLLNACTILAVVLCNYAFPLLAGRDGASWSTSGLFFVVAMPAFIVTGILLSRLASVAALRRIDYVLNLHTEFTKIGLTMRNNMIWRWAEGEDNLLNGESFTRGDIKRAVKAARTETRARKW